VPNFPKEGVVFKDIAPLLSDNLAFNQAIDLMASDIENLVIDKIAGIESRGFIFGIALAQKLGIGFVPIRKKGKLPGECWQQSYQLEYGNATIEIQKNSIKQNQKILIVDDVLATGGTCAAAESLITMAKAQVVGSSFLIELEFLKGQEQLSSPCFSLIKY